ncbi:Protein KCNL-4 b [Aphelenchoides avenae]|nr:Protein KCNL-4 b [Aphelenchus avenae]
MTAAARLGAYGYTEKPGHYTFYSSVPLRSFRTASEDEQDHCRTRSSRHGKGYGVAALSDEAVHERFRQRTAMLQRRMWICDWSLYVALLGLALAIFDVEIVVASGHAAQAPLISFFIRLVVIILTLLLDVLIVAYHVAEMQDASTRAIAAINRISVSFPFVLKSLVCERPLTLVSGAALGFWVISSWIMTQCERYTSDNKRRNFHYLSDYAWFVAVTFFGIGYGDVQAETYCGRAIGITTGIVGSVFSSLLTVLLSQHMLLSIPEKRVNQVIAESWLSTLHKHAAARVLQSTWRVVRLRKKIECMSPSSCGKTMFHLRMAQRNLLLSVYDFRRCRWKLRIRREEEDDVITVKRAFMETEERLRLLRRNQRVILDRVRLLTIQIDRLAALILARFGNVQSSVPSTTTMTSMIEYDK